MTGQFDAHGVELVSSDSKPDYRKRKPCSLGPGPWLSGTVVCLSATSQREAAGSLGIPDSRILLVWT